MASKVRKVKFTFFSWEQENWITAATAIFDDQRTLRISVLWIFGFRVLLAGKSQKLSKNLKQLKRADEDFARLLSEEYIHCGCQRIRARLKNCVSASEGH